MERYTSPLILMSKLSRCQIQFLLTLKATSWEYARVLPVVVCSTAPEFGRCIVVLIRPLHRTSTLPHVSGSAPQTRVENARRAFAHTSHPKPTPRHHQRARSTDLARPSGFQLDPRNSTEVCRQARSVCRPARSARVPLGARSARRAFLDSWSANDTWR